jgi:DNA-binding beta-propeller fold protein YncE
MNSRSLKLIVVCVFFLLLYIIVVVPVTASVPPFYATQWGSYGTGNGQFNDPLGIAVNATGYVYVADTYNDRIQEFTSTGTYMTQWGGPLTGGTGNGQFIYPDGIAVNATGYVYVADTLNNRIQEFDPSGTYVTQWGSSGTGNGQFNQPYGIAMNASDYIYVADSINSRIQVFTPSGTYVTQWGPLTGGTGNGQFIYPHGIAVNATGYVYVADTLNYRIQEFDPSGTYVTQWGSYGKGNGQFAYPYGIAVNATGYVYVADTFNNRIQEFDPSGNYVTQWGSAGKGNGQFSSPDGIAVSQSGNIYVADTYNSRIQEFSQIPVPVVTGITPAYGPITGGAVVTITGSGFTGATNVTFGTTAATSFTVINDTSITATAPAEIAGTVDVMVTTPNGISATSASDQYTYGAPAVTGITPAYGPITGGAVVTITGSGFTGATNVTFGTTAATSFTVINDTSITVTVPAEIAGTVDVTVTTPGGTSTISPADKYTYSAIPAVTGISPTIGPTSGGTSVTITGICFTGATNVTFGTTAATSFTVINDTSITATAPAEIVGTVDVTVTNPLGTSLKSISDEYLYEIPPPFYATQWGSYGTGNGQFNNPLGIAVNATGYVYVADMGNNRTQEFTPSGTYVTQWGSYGTEGGGKLEYPDGIAVNAAGYVYVVDTFNNQIEECTPSGTFTAIRWGGYGTGNGQFKQPYGIAVNASDYIYVADYYNSRIQEFDPSGTYVTQWGSFGNSPGQFSQPAGIAVNASDYIYVADSSNSRIQEFDPSGTYVTQWGSYGKGNGQFAYPYGIAVNATGYVYVADSSNSRIQEFDPSGTYVTQWGSYGTGNGQFSSPDGIAVSRSGNVYVADTGNNRIQEFSQIPVPVVTGITPAYGPITGGAVVTITGSGFTGATNVTFGTTAATSFMVINDTSITATAPAEIAGTVDVTVITPGGNVTESSAYTYTGAGSGAPIAGFTGTPTSGTAPLNVTFTDTSNVVAGTMWNWSFGDTSWFNTTTTSNPSHTYTTPGTYTVSLTVINATGSNIATQTGYITVTIGYTPTVSNITPDQGPLAGGTLITISGSGFTGASYVYFGTIAVPNSSFISLNDNQIIVDSPAGTAESVDVTVVGPSGTSAISPVDQFTYASSPAALPNVTGIAPDQGPVAGGTLVIIFGSGFTGATGVNFNTTPATNLTVVSDSMLTVTSPPGSSGVWDDVTVTTPNGTSMTTPADWFRYRSIPIVTGVSPVSGPVTGNTLITISGSSGFGFGLGLGNPEVMFGPNAATNVTVLSSTTLTATSPPGSPGTVDVILTTPGGTSSTSSADQFTYVALPTVTGVQPPTGMTTGGTLVTIFGNGFTGATNVTFGTTPATSFTVVNNTLITVTSPAHAAGTVDVTVTTAGGTSATSTADKYTYTAIPAVTGISPTAGPLTAGASVTITGSCFAGATNVTFGTTATTSFTVNNALSLTATAPAHAAGTVNVTVTTPFGTSAIVPADQYTYEGPPTVTKVNLNTGPLGGGIPVTITGTNLIGATNVYFGGIPAPSYTVTSATSITATTPGDGAGIVDVTVTTPVGTSPTSAADQFIYEAPPTLTKLSPNTGPLGGGTSVTITGTNLLGATNVYFGGTPATSYTVTSVTSITAKSPAEQSGPVDAVTVITPSGTSAIVPADQFTYTGSTQSSVAVTRSMPATVEPGANLIVTLTPGTTFATSPAWGVTEALPANWTFVSTTADGQSAVGGAYQFTELSATPITYTVTAPSARGAYTFNGTYIDGNKGTGTVVGAVSVTVVPDPLQIYDTNHDGYIEKSEAVQAATDYLFNGTLSKADCVTVITAYLFQTPVT